MSTPQPATYGRDPSEARFSVAKYQRMLEVGILTSEDEVELLENYVVLKIPRGPRHDGTRQVMSNRLGRSVPPGWDIRDQLAIVLPDSQPEPDCVVCLGDEATYRTRHPLPADIGLVVEVADSSLLRDQRDKSRIYARAGIPVYWIIVHMDRRIEVHIHPSGPTADPAYAIVQHLAPGDTVPLVLDGTTVATIPVADLLP
jgi:Uma2 family endonuclease